MNNNDALLKLIDVKKSFKVGNDKLYVLTGVNIEVKEGEIIALIGPSGSGKSTLLHIAGLLDRSDSGKVLIAGHDYSHAQSVEIDKIHQNKIGFIYQSNNLLNDFTAIENVMMPLLIQGIDKKHARIKAEKILTLMKLANRATHFPMQLSGGQCQRVAIARAIIANPLILLADEPTGNLDPTTGEEVFNQLMSIVKNNKLCLVIATHNPVIAKKCDKIFIMTSGTSIEVNTKNKKILQQNKDTKELIKQFY